MIIHAPSMRRENGTAVVEARVERDSDQPSLPETLWFSVPDSQLDFVSTSSDAFAVALLLVGMELGEPIELRGTVSPLLLCGLDEYQRFYHRFDPARFKLIDLSAASVAPHEPTSGQPVTACAFSGGADSFFTLHSHLAANGARPSAAVSHALFVQGVEVGMSVDADFAYDRHQAEYARLLRELQVEPLTLRTNARTFTASLTNYYFLGSMLASAAHVLAGRISRFYVASASPYDSRFLSIDGLNSSIDHLLSSERLTIVHDGAAFSRLEKLATLVDRPGPRALLRVCSQKPSRNGQVNCGRCEKCVRTMAMLELLDALPRVSTFRPRLSLPAMLRCRLYSSQGELRNYWEEILAAAIRRRNPKLVTGAACVYLKLLAQLRLRSILSLRK